MSDELTPRPCPWWCADDHDYPTEPGDGFWHYGPPVGLPVAPGPCDSGPEPVEVCLKSWVPEVEADPGPVLIDVSVGPEGCAEMTPAEARELAGILIRLSIQAEDPGQLRGARPGS